MSAAPTPRPFFEAPGGSPTARRLLLVSPLFAPAQQVGVLRWQKMAPYVVERGWELDVITIDPDCIASPDWSRLAELPPGTRLYGVRTPVLRVARLIETAWASLPRFQRRAPTNDTGVQTGTDSVARGDIRWALTTPRGYVRAYHSLFLYAQLRRWARDAATVARRLVVPGLYSAVVSSGPPNGAHEAARRVSRYTGLPFAMDMRDSWSLMQRCQEPIATPLMLWLDAWHERRAVNQASLVITNTEGAHAAMARAYPEARERMLTVMNGYDDEPLPPAQHGTQFIIAYAGTIYLDRDPRCLFRAAKAVIDALQVSPSQFALKFIGVNDWSVSLAEMAEAEGLGRYVDIGGSLPRSEALEFLARATMLVILPQDTDTAIPAKVFEYIRCDAWVLALAEPNSAIALMLRNTNADVVSSRDIAGIASAIRSRYEQFASGGRPRKVVSDRRLSRRYQAEILLDAIERLDRRLIRQQVYTAAL